MNRKPLFAALTAAFALAATPAMAVTNVENNASIPFSFSNPGARSLGMGGAFLGLADDATAAYTNPAGLTGLGLEKQFSIEVRQVDYDDSFVAGGTGSTSPFDLSGLQYGSASESVQDVSFLSFVWPAERWSLAFYRHQLVSYENAFESAPVNYDIPQFNGTGVIFPVRADTNLDIVNYGVSFGWRVNDALSIGAGLSWYDFDIDTTSLRYDPDGTFGSDASLLNVQRQDGSDDDVGFNFGLLYRGSDRVQVGFSYRSGPEFDYRHTNVAGAGNAVPGEVFLDRRAGFATPDMFGVGLAWRATDALTLTVDINRINYSQITDPTESAFFTDDELTDAGRRELSRLQIDSVIEPHIGMEYVFFNMDRPLSLRLGAWYEDRHTIRFDGDLRAFETDLNTLGNAFANAALFSTGEDEVHYAFGLGWAFSNFQVDFAADIADNRETISLSGVWRF